MSTDIPGNAPEIVQSSKKAAECQVAKKECTEARGELSREVKLTAFVKENDYFGLGEEHAALITTELHKFEHTNKGEDVTKYPLEALQGFLRPKIVAEKESEKAEKESEKAEKESEKAKEEAEKAAYEKHVATLKDKGFKGMALVAELLKNEGNKVPETELGKLQAYHEKVQQFVGLATNDQERSVLAGIADQYTDAGDLEASFAMVVEQALGSDAISEGTKETMRKQFGYIENGAELKKAVEGSNEDNPVGVRDGVTAWAKDGKMVLRARVGDHTLVTQLDQGAFDVHAQEWMNYMIAFQTLEKMGMSDFFSKGMFQVDGASDLIIDQNDIQEMRRAVQPFLGDFAGREQILTQGNMAQMKHGLQWLHPKGDWAEDDYDTAAMRGNLKDLGIMDKNGEILWSAWEKAGKYIQANYGNGAPDYGALKKYLG